MSKGYIITVQGNYLEQAELLAKSIHATQTQVTNISIVTDQTVTSDLFDQVIPLPVNNLGEDTKWKIHNRIYNYDLSPYDETVMLDADMIFLSNIDHWWSYMAKHDLLITNRVKTFKDEWVNESVNPYRETFRGNNLDNTYSAFTYFKKSDKAKDFFDLLKNIIINWEQWSMTYSPEHRQKWPSIDVAMSIACKILGYDDVTPLLDYPTFTHMKGRCQGYPAINDRWSESLGYSVTEDHLRVGAYIQSGIFHYCEKDFVKGKIQRMFK